MSLKFFGLQKWLNLLNLKYTKTLNVSAIQSTSNRNERFKRHSKILQRIQNLEKYKVDWKMYLMSQLSRESRFQTKNSKVILKPLTFLKLENIQVNL